MDDDVSTRKVIFSSGWMKITSSASSLTLERIVETMGVIDDNICYEMLNHTSFKSVSASSSKHEFRPNESDGGFEEDFVGRSPERLNC
ncbi:hypothetical protein CCACVL1_14750 [Corchorus capsularis]|uniref:Uncharacterized protein n=1 Tax=Corchorus capsularis TaxID=210143 RepID=A0A1R3I5L6_COCAP|nr:hypothetical protein CCACVL1_14750 [Corchorus capsularis]